MNKVLISALKPQGFLGAMTTKCYMESCCHLNFRYGTCFKQGVP